ncbi:MAG: hypothetical protein CENE_01608 [Candidatus Celerinatantimonas neptuna]|nr:MAG: hypothetical protein CENE_01608 [Candidatus Celerinatantimonas neptuna]
MKTIIYMSPVILIKQAYVVDINNNLILFNRLANSTFDSSCILANPHSATLGKILDILTATLSMTSRFFFCR